MRKFLLSLLLPGVAFAQSVSSPTTASVPLVAPGGDYVLSFEVSWTCDDYPQNSAPGRIELLDGSGTVVGQVTASSYRGAGAAVILTGPGVAAAASTWVNVYAPNGTPADGGVAATWTIPGLPAGHYTIRLWNYVTNDRLLQATSIWTTTTFTGGSSVTPPPVTFVLTTGAGAGGTVSAGGNFDAGTMASVTAFPDATHDFAGWSGDATGPANPVAVLMNANKAVQAMFVPKSYVLTTGAGSGGSVTPGGTYPLGTTVTVSATPDATHYFVGWTGDAGGTNLSVAVLLDRAKSVQALFAGRAAQTISFAAPGDHPVGTPAFTLDATASSGLPVSFAVAGGPATVTGNRMQVHGPGTVIVQATQAGDALTLPAPPVTQSFNVTSPAVLKYQTAARIHVQSDKAQPGATFVLQP